MRAFRLLTLSAATVLSAAGCSEYGVSPEEVIEDPIPDTDEPDGGVKPNPFPDDVLLGGAQGTICSEPDLPLEGAIVRVEHAYGVAETATNEEGFFQFEELPAGEHVLVVSHDTYNTQIVIQVPPNESVTVLDDECVDDCGAPVPCMGLMEAFDRNHAQVMAGPGGTVQVFNVGTKYDICLDPWVVVTSLGSQDAIVGQEPVIRLAPGESHIYDYAVDVFGDEGEEAWWCVELNQVIADGVYYDYNGSLAPDILWNYIHDRTDTNYNDVEDHDDINHQGRIQSQLNIWNTQDWQPIVLVGRERSLFRLEERGDTATVTVQALNLGHLPTTSEVFEIVPPGFIVLDTEPVAMVTSSSDGSTTIRWDVDLEGGIPVQGGQTQYDRKDLTYTLGVDVDDPCQGRCVGNGVYGSWVDAWSRAQESFSEPLILEVCKWEDAEQ